MTAGISTARVFAVVAELASGRFQIGSGFLMSANRVITASHCTVDSTTGISAEALQVHRLSDRADFPVTEVHSGPELDVAVLDVDFGEAMPRSRPVKFARVDRTRTGELRDCHAVGFPLWQYDESLNIHNSAELHGLIRVTDDLASGYLVLRDPALNDVGNGLADSAVETWGGLSGAVAFHDGRALGVVVEHHPRQGGSAARILPFERLASLVEEGAGEDVESLVDLIGLPRLSQFSETTPEPVRSDWLAFTAGHSAGSTFDAWLRGSVDRLRRTDEEWRHAQVWQDVRRALLEWAGSTHRTESLPVLNLLGLHETYGLYLDDVHISQLLAKELIVRGHCSIENAVITDLVSFEAAEFDCAASFAGSKVGAATFRGCGFRGPADFAGARFDDYVDFTDAVFDEGVLFHRSYGSAAGSAHFHGATSFTASTFGRAVDLSNCIFDGPLNFEDAQALRSIDLQQAHFLDEALLARTHAIGDVGLDGCHCLDLIDLSGVRANSVSYEDLRTWGADYAIGLDSITEDSAMPRRPRRKPGTRS